MAQASSPLSASDPKQIVSYLRKNISQIDKAVLKARTEIDLVREYRNRLVADAVTGKLDVRQFDATTGLYMAEEGDAGIGEDALGLQEEMLGHADD